MLPSRDKFVRGDSPVTTPRTGKYSTIRSRLLSHREHQKDQKQECYTNIVMDPLMDDVFERNNSALTIEVLRKELRLKLLKPLRLIRTPSFHYLNVETEDLSKAYLIYDSEKNYALLWAAFNGDLDNLERLYDQGADINFVHSGDNFNALHLSALNGSVECTHWLLSKGCHIITTEAGYSPLHFAVLGNSQRICRYLIESGCRIDVTALHSAVHANSLDCVQYLLGLQVPVNGYDNAGMTPLHIASDIGNLRILRELLDDKRVKINAKTKAEKYTALHLAAENGYGDCLQLLLKHDADVNAQSAKLQTPLYLACKQAHIDCVEILLEHEATVNVQDNEKRTPLHAAVSKSPNSLQIVQRLVDRKADVHLADDFGYTALHIAALNELDECVEYLIMNGANVAAKTVGHMTALNIINRKTPLSVDKIGKRLNLALAYNTEQSLKFSFRDIIRNSLCGEIGYLYTLQREGQAKVLEHPLCEAFLHLKWQKVRFFILLRVAIALVAVILLSAYVLWGITKQCYNAVNGNKTEFEKNNCTDKSIVGDILLGIPNLMTYGLGFVLLLMVLNLVRIIFSFAAYKSAKHFLRKPFNVLELVVTIGAFTLVIKDENNGIYGTYPWQNTVGGLTVLFSWAYVMVTVGQLPSIGTYVAMFNKVLKEFLKMVMAFICLLLGFTFSFCVLKKDKFNNPAEGLTRIMGMMTGELNVNDIISAEDTDGGSPNDYFARTATIIVLSLFTIFVTIVLMNLLVGIAVNDVEGLRKTADLCKLIQQTKLIHFLERVCFKGYFPTQVTDILKRFLYVWPNSYTVVMYVRPLSPHETRLPRDVMEAGLKIALDRSKARYNKSRETQSAEQRIQRLEEQIIKLQDMVSEMNASVRNLAGVPSPALSTIDEVPDCDNEISQT